MKSNLANMIEQAQRIHGRVVLAGMQMPPNYGIEYTREFAAVYPELAAEYDVALIGFFLEGVALNPELMQQDGIRPNKLGQPILLQNVWLVLEGELEVSADTS